MFESAELGHKVGKRRYHREVPKLREALLEAQYELRDAARFPVIILFGGVQGAGRSETVNTLHTWMDPRLITAHAFREPREDERVQPRLYRFWRALPMKGRIGIMFGSWYTDPLEDKVEGRTRRHDLDAALEEIVRFERMLVNEGALILKFWMHLSKADEKQRLKALENDPLTRWRVTHDDWRRFRAYGKYKRWSEAVLRSTSRSEAPWIIVEGEDREYRELTVGRALLEAMRARLAGDPARASAPETPVIPPPVDGLRQLDQVELGCRMPRAKYEDELVRLQAELGKLTRYDSFGKRRVVLAFEGPDAAGKGGTIRRITAALDARMYRVIPIAAPSEEERAQPYLWRFWQKLPEPGSFAIFDRSWYGRVLVERVEGLCSEYDWQRAYAEINDFESQLVDSGVLLLKFWLAISKEEQLVRFKERERTGFKRYKITREDYRNRKKWDAYTLAANDVFDRTSTDEAPWTLVSAEDKHHARITVLRTVVEALARQRR
jgi:AMP-polyphosphate phosphotransferase